MNVLRKTTHPSQIQNSPTGSISKRNWESKSKRVVPTKKKKRTLKNVLKKNPPSLHPQTQNSPTDSISKRIRKSKSKIVVPTKKKRKER
jgi:hypothetical protein